MYSGNMIGDLVEQVAAHDPLRWYALQNKRTKAVCPPEREILESAATLDNIVMTECGSDWRWCVLPERGSR